MRGAEGMDTVLTQYWASLPVGKAQALSYEQLECKWLVGKRQVRKIMERLSCFDNGDTYILIRSSKGGGFYLTDDARKKGGFGLGLSIAKNVANALGGEIFATSDDNGTTFTVKFKE